MRRQRPRGEPWQYAAHWAFQRRFLVKRFSVEHGYLDICFKYLSSFARMIFR